MEATLFQEKSQWGWWEPSTKGFRFLVVKFKALAQVQDGTDLEESVIRRAVFLSLLSGPTVRT